MYILCRCQLTGRERGIKLGLSFSDCPNRCVDGYYVNPYTHKRIKCEYCANKRRETVQQNMKLEDGESINEKLNLPKSYQGYGSFDINQIIPEYSSKVMEKESVEQVGALLESLLQKISVGDVSEFSVLFNLGKKAFENNFIYAYLVRAYIAGLKVSPFITAYELYELREGHENSLNADRKYEDFIKSDVCVVTIDAGSNTREILCVKGLMQLRANYSRSTLIFTGVWNSVVRDMCTDDGVGTKSLALLSSIVYDEKYIEREKNYESAMSSVNVRNNPRGISSREFDSLLNSKTTL